MPKNRLIKSILSPVKLNVANCRHQSGASLLEALIAMVVVSVGLLGIAGLQMTALQSANDRPNIVLANDFGERLWAVSSILEEATESDRATIVKRTRDQWSRDHDFEIIVDEQSDCTLPDCCPHRICFVESESIPSKGSKESTKLIYVEPGTKHPEYTFQIRSQNIFTVVLPPAQPFRETSQ